MRSSIFSRICLLTGLTLTVTLAVGLPAQAQKQTKKTPLVHKKVLPTRLGVPELVSWTKLHKRVAAMRALEKQREAREEAKERRSALNSKRPRQKVEPEEESLDVLNAILYYTRQRAYPNERIDQASRRRAAEYGLQMPVASLSAMRPGKPPLRNTQPLGGRIPTAGDLPPDPAPDETGQWKFLGPTNATPSSRWAFGPGVINGRVNSIAYDPKQRGVYYLASPSGGVWKSTDYGKNWKPLTDTQVGYHFSKVVVDPNDSQVVYAGTGDYDGQRFDSGFGLLKSADGGATWSRLGTSVFGNACIRAILIDPANTKNILVGTGMGGDVGRVYRTTDGGQTWTATLEAGGVMYGWVGNLTYNSNRSAVYAAVDGSGVWKSTDNGESWNQVLVLDDTNTSPPFAAPEFRYHSYRVDMAASLVNPDTVYAASDGQKRVYRTRNGGVSWQNAQGNLPTNGIWSQSFYDFYIATSKATVWNRKVNPPVAQVKDVVYIGLLGIYSSTDGGLTWQNVTQTYSGNDLVHTDQHCLTVSPYNPNEMLVGNDGGINRLVYNPESKPPTSKPFTAVSLNATLGITEFYAAAFHPTDKKYMMGGTQDNATPRSRGGLLDTLLWDNVGSGDGAFCAINFTKPDNQYNSWQFLSVNRTDNSWGVSTSIAPNYGTENVEFIAPFVIDNAPTDSVLYAGTQYVYQYKREANPNPTNTTGWNKNWTKFTDKLAEEAQFDVISTVAAASTLRVIDNNNTAQYLYAGTARGRVWVSSDQGKDFREITGDLPRRYVRHILVSPHAPNRIYVALSGSGAPHLWRCDDVNNPTWVDISGSEGESPLPDVPINHIALSLHEDEQSLYVGTDFGVYFSADGGETWANAGTALGLPNVQVSWLDFVPSTGYLQAATYGRGMWRIMTGNDIPFQFYPRMEFYRGGKANLKAKLEFYVADQHDPARNIFGAPIESRTVSLSAAGWLSTRISASGTYDLYVTLPRYLRKKIASVATGDYPIITDLVNIGDVNGDNSIDGADLAQVQQNLGKFTNAPVDVDGDGQVTARDAELVTRNLGKRGD